LSGIIKIFKSKGIKNIILSGKARKIRLFSGLKPDFRTLKLLMSLKDNRDTTVLKAVISEFARDGIKVLPTSMFIEEFFAGKGRIAGYKPRHSEFENIKYGYKIAKSLADLDIGQTVIVRNKTVIAVEAAEGTDNTIKRAGNLGKKDMVCIKTARSKQDLRIDIPAIGVNTIRLLDKAGVRCIAVEAGRVLIVEPEKTFEKAKKAGICIYGI
jgi:hypothetical protein